MIRLVSLLVLAAMGILAALSLRPRGSTAIGFSFLGMPLIALVILLQIFLLWRKGAFRTARLRSRGSRES